MKEVLRFVALLVLASLPAVSQTQVCGPHPTDPTAVLIGSYTVTVDISTSSTVSGKGTKKGTKCTFENLICVFRTATGAIDLVGDPTSVKVTGDCDVSAVAPVDLFDMLGRAAASKAVQLGYVQCNPNCTSNLSTRYLTATCVQRSGSGTSTRYAACSTEQCVRAYTICCPYGPSSPVIQDLPASNVSCGAAVPAGCETACPQSSTGTGVVQ